MCVQIAEISNMKENTLSENDIEELRKEVNHYFFSKDSNFKDFYESRRTESGKKYFLDIIGYLKDNGGAVPLRQMKKDLMSKHTTRLKIKHETTLYRLLADMVKGNILEKYEDIEPFSRSKPDKRMTNTKYEISKKIFDKKINEDVIRFNKMCDATIKYANELSAAKELLEEMGINDPDEEIKKRVHKHTVYVSDDDGDDQLEQKWEEYAQEEWTKRAVDANTEEIIVSYKGITAAYRPEKEED